MRTIHFPNWPQVLSARPLAGRVKHSFEIKIRRLFAGLDDKMRLMARVMFGAGLRLFELLRSRVKDLDLERRS